MRLCKAFACWVLLVCLPFTVSALGLGNISLDSALNEPFAAEVPLESVGNTDLNELEVTLGSIDTFERYGLDKPQFLNSFTFSVAKSEAGRPVVVIRSTQPVSEPFVTFLLDVKWPSGRLLREYTVLLDPPIYDAQPVQQTVAPAATVAEPADFEPVPETVPDTAEFANAEVLAPMPLDAGMDEEAVESAPSELAEEPEVVVAPEPVVESAPAAVAPAAPVASAAPATVAGSYEAAKGDTLWGISERARDSSGLTNNQMMMAIYRANPEAFIGNINGLKAGAILRIPEAGEVAAVDVREANAEARQQHAAWSDGPASALPVADSNSGARSSGQLELVVPGAEAFSGDGTGSDASGEAGESLGQLEAEQQERDRLLQIQDDELSALQERVIELDQSAPADAGLEVELEAEVDEGIVDEGIVDEGIEVEVGDGEILVEGLEEPLESPFADDAEVLADDSVASDTAVAPEAAPADEPASATAATTEEDQPSFIGALLGNYWLWGAAGFVLLLALFLARRRVAGDDADATGTWDTDVPPADDADETLKDFSELPTFEESIVVDEVDDVDSPAAEPVTDDSLFAEPILDAEEAGANTGVDFDLGDTDIRAEAEAAGQTSSLEQLDAVDAAAGPDDEVESQLEKTISTGAPLNLDQADPVAEAEFHMAYGLYDQAAELLVRALGEEPDNRPYRVKLLEVYFVWENKEGFLEQATALRDSIPDESDSDWNKVLILGKQLCPDSDLFTGKTAAVSSADAMDLELSDDAGEMDVDFSLSGTEVEALNEGEFSPGNADDGLDFDLSDAASEEASTEGDGDLDFDLGNFGDDDDAEISLDLGDGDDAGEVSLDLTGADAGLEYDETMRIDEDDLAQTVESSTVRTSGGDEATVEADMGGATLESPTLDMNVAGMSDDDSLESTMESPTLDVPGSTEETAEMPGLDQGDLNDPTSLDVDLSGLADLGELDDAGDNAPDIDSTLNQLDNTGELLTLEDMTRTIADEDATLMAPVGSLPDDDSGDDDETMLAPIGSLPDDAGLSSDTVQQPVLDEAADGDTAEQPEISMDELAGLDDDDAATPEDATMTEVGTKLDLARAYIDMGDPDGARSILNEVLDEGGGSQQQEARQLLEELGN